MRKKIKKKLSLHSSILTPTRYTDNINDSNLVIDIMFLQCNSSVLNNHSIHPEWHLSSNHASLTVTIPIPDEFINTHKSTIQKNSIEEEQFVNDTISAIKNLDILNLLDILLLEKAVSDFVKNVDNAWNKNTKLTNIMKHSKSWWDYNCSRDLKKYRSSKSLEDWKSFHKTVKNTKRTFLDLKITEIANKKWGPWELMNWVNKQKLSAPEAIKFNGQPCLELDNLWQVLHSMFNTAQHHYVKSNILNKLGPYSFLSWAWFMEEEFASSLLKCSNMSTSGLDKLL